MTPDFALSLSFGGIALLSRASASGGPEGGWYSLGEVALDVDDLAGALAVLQEEAVANPGMEGPEVKLILPNEQIKLISVPRDDSESVVQAEVVLRDATPYAVDELVFDWHDADGMLHVAAVARETLQEAESFARDHRFLPISFVAMLPEDVFGREPFFGPTDSALTQLAPGVAVRPDEAQVTIIPGAPPVTQSIAVDAEAPTEEPEPPTPTDPEPEAPEAPLASPVSVPETAPSVGAPVADAAEPTMAFSSLRAERGATGRKDTPSAPDPQAEGRAPKVAAEPAVPPTPKAEAPPVARPEAALKPTFAQAIKARAQESLAEAKAAPPPKPVAPPKADPAQSSRSVSNVLARAQSGLGRGVGFISRRRGSETPERVEDAPPAAQTAAAGATSAALTSRAKMDEADRMTVFGARRQNRGGIGGKPRFLGLILTAALLIFLLGVAAWASVFVDDGLARFFGEAEETQVDSALSTPTLPEPEAEDTTSATPELVLPPSPELPAAPADTSPTDLAALSPGLPAAGSLPLSDPDGLSRPIGAGALSPEEAEARYAATGIWQRSPLPPAELRQGVLDDLLVASLDANLELGIVTRLPEPRGFSTDAAMQPVLLPPRPDERFSFDERGLIRPTEDGVVAPGGYTLVLGRPGLLPPERPGAETTPVETDDQSEVLEAPEETTETPAINLELAGKRPLSRPEALVPEEAATEAAQDPVAFAGIRPLARPAAVTARATATEAAPEVEAAQAGAEDSIEENPGLFASLLGTAPTPRPENMPSIVRQTDEVSSASATPIVARIPQTVTPQIPSGQSVARAATQNNAINLRRVNLIGVYGKPSDRRALVRLANGRFQKVKVGDRLDGGRILAISDTQLRYQKSGRNVTLDMPQG